MRNPFRSEGDAFRFVLLTIGYFALIVIGSVINSWVGLAVFLVLTGLALWAIFRRREPEAPVQQAPPASPPDERRVLVVANETVGGPELLAEIRARSAGRRSGRARRLPRAQLAAPALGLGRGRRARGGGGAARAAASASMRAAGLDATGEIGDGDPLQAIEDALRTFRPGRADRLDSPGRAARTGSSAASSSRRAERFALPVTHVVVDLDA